MSLWFLYKYKELNSYLPHPPKTAMCSYTTATSDLKKAEAVGSGGPVSIDKVARYSFKHLVPKLKWGDRGSSQSLISGLHVCMHG